MWQDILKRLRNKGTVVALVSGGMLFLHRMGIQVDNDKVMAVVDFVSLVGVLLGIFNNPSVGGGYSDKEGE